MTEKKTAETKAEFYCPVEKRYAKGVLRAVPEEGCWVAVCECSLFGDGQPTCEQACVTELNKQPVLRKAAEELGKESPPDIELILRHSA